MASNKNQHFVPRCYLRGFTRDRAVIHLFNLDRRRAISAAPLKGQCSRDYFYGDDLRLERVLQCIEVGYTPMLADIARPGYQLTLEHRSQLLDFWCVQYMRTEAASKRAVQAADELNGDMGMTGDEWRLNIRQAVEMSMGLVPALRDIISDLKPCLIRNLTGLPFITSDDPAVAANRWHQQDVRTRNMAAGLGSAGALLFLPLTPELLCLFYDGAIYSIEQTAGWATASIADVAAFNEHQYLRAFANVYFRDWDAHAAMSPAYDRLAARRPPVRFRFNHAVFDRMEGDARIFRAVDAAEARLHESSMIHQEAIDPVPTGWPRLIRFRPDGHAWFNGSGVGYSRRATLPPGADDFRKIPTRRAAS
ncbi:DUF4238 domain-containing protein [Rhizorhabdus argentea]|uniref:DUF4238 domain-containing protein n=1 Tax=Rhizorhabdus argentea TaxID=1387174 RepID=UPI0030EEFEC8